MNSGEPAATQNRGFALNASNVVITTRDRRCSVDINNRLSIPCLRGRYALIDVGLGAVLKSSYFWLHGRKTFGDAQAFEKSWLRLTLYYITTIPRWKFKRPQVFTVRYSDWDIQFIISSGSVLLSKNCVWSKFYTTKWQESMMGNQSSSVRTRWELF